MLDSAKFKFVSVQVTVGSVEAELILMTNVLLEIVTVLVSEVTPLSFRLNCRSVSRNRIALPPERLFLGLTNLQEL